MSNFIGEVFQGVVSGVTSFGMFVELDNSVEGLIRLENMTDDYYEFDEKTSALIGRRKKRIYTVGNTVKIVLANTNILLRQIDFVLEKDCSSKLLNNFTKKEVKKTVEKPKRRNG